MDTLSIRIFLPHHVSFNIVVDTSKKRIKIRRSMSKNSSLLETTVSKYNAVVKLSAVQVPEISLAEISSGRFTWQGGSGMNLWN